MSTIALDEGHLTVRRARVRADVALAGRVVPVARPLDEFVAVNPLAGFEERPFPEAIAEAASLYGIHGFLPEQRYRSEHRRGRITDDDLRWAIRCAARPTLDDQGAVDLEGDGDRIEQVVRDLLAGAAPERAGRSVLTAAEQQDGVLGTDLFGEINRHTVRWCAAFLGTEAAWRMPGREKGLYGAWRELVAEDSTLDVAAQRQLTDLPERSDDAVLAAFDRLGVLPDQRREVLRAELTALPGWAAHLRWRAEHRTTDDLVDYLAIRLSYLAALIDPRLVPLRSAGAAVGADHLDALQRSVVWQDAYERNYRNGLLTSITANGSTGAEATDVDAQIVCCIDVRSEGLRRAIEDQGRYETLGFAGFFAVAMAWTPMAGGASISSCPALVSPRHEVTEAATGTDRSVARYRRGLEGEAGALDALHAAKDTPGTAFALAEAAGWVTGPAAAVRTLAPRGWSRAGAWFHRRAAPEPERIVETHGIPFADRVLTARTALVTMGLARFAPVVALCGHTSSTAANPYEAALRCGACGGHSGGPNARVLASILNDPDVRAELASGDDALVIPPGTIFVAAEHDTTSDAVTILDRSAIPLEHRARVAQLQADLDVAGQRHAVERCRQLPGAPTGSNRVRARRHVLRRANDWAETFPEWGLAGNAAFVVGPRSLTRGLDLESRVFLHSYDPGLDRDGRALETILTAPLVVAQWINCQYYFSTTDPDIFGSGTKTVHNPVGTVGIMAGRIGDLRLGLPLQSVAQGDDLVHEPLRLLAVVQAPLARVAGIVDRNPSLRDLVAGGWITLVARAGPDDDWMTWTADGWIDTDQGARP